MNIIKYKIPNTNNPLGNIIQIKSMISKNDCDNILELCLKSDNWNKNRFKYYPTEDIEIMKMKECVPFVNKTLDLLTEKFKEIYKLENSEISLGDMYVLKYDSNEKSDELRLHRDDYNFAFVISLNDDYEGGGTYYDSLKKIIKCETGDILIHCGKLLHSGNKVNKGIRYIISGFLDVKSIKLHNNYKKLSDMIPKQTDAFWLNNLWVDDIEIEKDEYYTGDISKYLEHFINYKYVKIPVFYKEDQINEINNKINELRKTKYYKYTNNYVFSYKRCEHILYENNISCENEEEYNILNEHFTKMKEKLYDILKIKYLKEICDTIEPNTTFSIQRICYIEVKPGCPEQPIHKDWGEEQTIWGMKTFYVTIALHDVIKEMGGTIVYDYNKVKTIDDACQEERNLLELHKGDINIHNEQTVHHGGANKSNKTRRFLFVVLTKNIKENKKKLKLTKLVKENQLFYTIDSVNTTINNNSDVNIYNKQTYIYLKNFIKQDDFNHIKNLIFHLYDNNEYCGYSNNWACNNNNKRLKIYYYIKNVVCENEETENKLKNHFNIIYDKLMCYMNDILIKVKELHSCDYISIDRIFMFKVLPGCEEQKIHLDSPMVVQNKAQVFKQTYITIPLHFTPTEMGGTTFYSNEYVEKYKSYPASTGKEYGYFNELKGEMKKDFEKAKYSIQYNERDIAVHTTDTLHNGMTNNSNKMRYYLFVILHTSKQSEIPIAPVKITNYKNYKCIDILSDQEIKDMDIKKKLDNKPLKNVDPIKKFFEKSKFLQIREFFNRWEFFEILDTIKYLRSNNKLCKNSNNFANNSVIEAKEPDKRVQTLLHVIPDQTEIHSEKEKNIINTHVRYLFNLIKPILSNKINQLIYRLYGSDINWSISRCSIMDIYPGCSEQQIHRDGHMKTDEKDLYMFIPLMNHNKDIGGTIYYDNTIIKKYVDTKAETTRQSELNYGYFNELKGEMKKDFEKARIIDYPLMGDINIHTNETLHNGATNKSNKIRHTLFLIITIHTKPDYKGVNYHNVAILKEKNKEKYCFSVKRGKDFMDKLGDKLTTINPDLYKSQYDILPIDFKENILKKGFYIIKNDNLKHRVHDFKDLLYKIYYTRRQIEIYNLWFEKSFSGNPYILHDKREMIELYQRGKLMTSTLKGIDELEKEENKKKIFNIHCDIMTHAYKIMLHFTPLIFDIISKMGYKSFIVTNVKYYNILSGGKDQQLHCDGGENDGDGDHIYLIYSLQDTTYDMGGTNFYEKDKLKEEYKNMNPDTDEFKSIGFIEELKNKEMFYNSEYKCLLKEGEMSVHSNNTIHKGCGNKSSINREFIFFLIEGYK